LNCSLEFQRRFQHEWIAAIGYGARKYDEAVGDFFEFAAMFFLARGWRRHLMAMVIDNCINQFDDQNSQDGTYALGKAIKADKEARGSEDYHNVAMLMQHMNRPRCTKPYLPRLDVWQNIADS